MKNQNFIGLVVVLVVLTALGAQTVKPILYTDKPNAVPIGSDFFSLQRNSDFINASVSQVKVDWFNNPVFTGNGGIQGNWRVDGSGSSGGSWTVGGSMFLPLQPNLGGLGTDGSGKIIAGAAFGGNQFILTQSGFGTNLTLYGGGNFFGTYYFDEVDALNFFPTNLFTGDTNFFLLGTDGNGQLRSADAVAVTFSNQFRVDVTHAFVASNATASAMASFDAVHNLTNAAVDSATLSFSSNKLSVTDSPLVTQPPIVSFASASNSIAMSTNINNTYFFLASTAVSLTNVTGSIAGQMTYADFYSSNSLATSITNYETIPGAKIFGVNSATTATNAIIIPAGKEALWHIECRGINETNVFVCLQQ